LSDNALVLQALPSEFRGSVIALGWIVRPVLYDESDFMARNLAIVCGVRELQEYFFSDGEAQSYLSGKVFFDELAIGTSKVVDGVGKILTDVDLPVWVGYLVNNLHFSISSLLPFFDKNV